MYTLRIPFQVPDNVKIVPSTSNVSIDGLSWSLKWESSQNAQQLPTDLSLAAPVFYVSGFPDKEAAQNYVARVRVLLNGLMVNRKVSLIMPTTLSEAVLTVAKETATMNGAGTLTIYPSSYAPQTVFGAMSVHYRHSADELLKAVQVAAPSEPNSIEDPKLLLALDLYRSHDREATPRSQFIKLVTVLESLAEPIDRPPEVLAILEDWDKVLRTRVKASGVSPEAVAEFGDLINEISRRRMNSIGNQLCRLVEAAVKPATDEERRDLWKTTKAMYSARSDLLHNGTADHKTLNESLLFAMNIVPKVLRARMNAPDSSRASP